MQSGVSAFIASVVGPLFGQVGLGPIIAGLVVFVIGWAVFMAVVGRRD